MYFKKRFRVAVWAISVGVGVSIMLIPLALGLYVPEQPYLIPLSQRVNNVFALGLVIAFGFPAVVEYSNYVWGRQIEHAIPRLLRDVAESVRSSVTLPRAVEEASQRGYGPLSKELEHVISMFVLGASWEEAMMSLAKRVRRPSVSRMATVLIEANQTGGRMSEVLDTSVELFSSLDEFKEEQFNNMRPYLFTIYMATIIFLVIAYVVLHQFLAPLSVAATNAVAGEAGMLPSVLDIGFYASILFWASMVESFFGGFIAGKIGDRSYSAGLRHSVILIVVTLVFFNVTGV
jgi:flagellar protein FlaJ